MDEEDYHYALVSELAVDEAHRGRGIGRALIAASEAYARDKGARWLRITVLGRNAPARGLYEAYGFEERLLEMEMPLQDK